jgi:outer membrane receptor protein involved in Fe transport
LRPSRTLAALFATSAMTGFSPAFAQTAATTGSVASTSPQDVAPVNGEIIVTATKRAENIQNVPISITALGNVTLEQHQVQSLDDYVKLLPSVSFQSFGPGQSELYFRGIATGGDGIQSGPRPSSGLYVDEIPLTTIGSSVDFHVYDISRVEALAGPQGTLFGASSLSGTLRIITNQPDPSHFSGGFDLQGDKFGPGSAGGQAEGFVNVPLSERAAIRIVGFYDHEGGYIDNKAATRCYNRVNDEGYGSDVGCPGASAADLAPGQTYDPLTVNNAKFAKNNFNDVDTYGGRALLKIDLDDNWTATPGVMYQHQDAHGTYLFDPSAGDLKVHDFTPDHNLDHWYLASLTVQGKLSNWDVTYAGSYFARTIDNTQDYSYFSVAYDPVVDYNLYKDAAGNDIDPTQIYHAHDTYTKMSHELRISSPKDEPIRLTAGLFMQRQSDHHIADYEIDGLANAVVYYNTPIPGANSNDVFYTDIHRVDRDYAAFAEASYDILPNLTLTGGIRGFMAKNTLTGFSGSTGTLGHFNCTGTAEECKAINGRVNESGETHKVNLTWKIDRDKMVYFTYSTGFRPGGNNRPAFALGQVQNPGPYAPDTLTNYEIGWKTSWFDHTLRVNGALFWEDWSKVQYTEPGILGIQYTVNAGNARSRGVEGDVSWTIAHHLTLSTSGTYLDAKLTSNFCNVQYGCDPANGGALFAPKGTRLPVTPKLKITGTARYDFDIGAYRSFVQGTVNHQSGTTTHLLLADAGTFYGEPTKGFTTADFSVGTSYDKWTASLFIQNAFDKRGILSKNSVCVPGICGAYARVYPVKPQYFGVRLGAKF